jgi:hypothetical protein
MEIKTGYGTTDASANSLGFKKLSGAYNEKEIREISDNSEGKAEGLQVAVPSPFALLDLPRTAFKNALEYISSATDGGAGTPPANFVVAGKEDFKLVSYVLDMIELFVEYHSELTFIEVNQTHLDGLRYSKEPDANGNKKDNENKNHLNLGNTLERFKKLDKAFGFVNGNDFKIYLVEYKGKIIGGTSKDTIFFVTRNYDDLKNITIVTECGKTRKLFSSDFNNYDANYKSDFLEDIKKDFTGRGEKFKKWIVSKLFGAEEAKTSIGKYIKKLNDSLEKPVQVDETPILQCNNGYDFISFDLSGECISIETKIDEEKKKTEQAKYEQKDAIFAKYLIKIPYKPSGLFKTLKVEDDKENTYLYPLNSGVNIDYGTIKGEQVHNGIRVWANGIDKCYFYDNDPARKADKDGIIAETDFALRLFPFVRGSKEYRVMLIEDLVKRNKQQYKFDVWFDAEIQKLFEADKDNRMETSYLFIENPELDPVKAKAYEPIINLKGKYDDEEFQICLPVDFDKQVTKANEAKYSFAVDFGTTNTHIEYFMGNFAEGSSVENIKPFSLKNHMATLLDLDDVEKKSHDSLLISSVAWNEFLPKDEIGGENKFPFRTLLQRTGNQPFHNDKLNSLGKFVIPFEYKSNLARGKIFSDLKWEDSDEQDSAKEIYKHFLREIIFLLYAKVLIEGGPQSVEETEVCYSYPIAMEPTKRDAIKEVWEELYEYFFGSIVKNNKPMLRGTQESLAPLKYFLAKGTFGDGMSFSPKYEQYTLCIDIGGGSTDVIVVTENEETEDINVLFHTSFKFAGNDVFGGSLVDKSNLHFNFLTNDYIDYYGSQEKQENGQMKGLLYRQNRDNSYVYKEGNIYGDNLNKVISDSFSGDVSGEVSSYLFSLEKILGKENYMEKLKKNLNVKVGFLYFFSAIIYNVIKILKDNDKSEDGEIPVINDIIFSGNGSNILHILGTQEQLNVVVKNILEIIYGKKIQPSNLKRLKVRFAENPKALTAKGCLIPPEYTKIHLPEEEEELESLKKILYEGYKSKQIIKEINTFHEAFVELLSKEDIEKKFSFPAGQRKNIEKLCESYEASSRDLGRGHFIPLRYFILKLFREFIKWVPKSGKNYV